MTGIVALYLTMFAVALVVVMVVTLVRIRQVQNELEKEKEFTNHEAARGIDRTVEFRNEMHHIKNRVSQLENQTSNTVSGQSKITKLINYVDNTELVYMTNQVKDNKAKQLTSYQISDKNLVSKLKNNTAEYLWVDVTVKGKPVKGFAPRVVLIDYCHDFYTDDLSGSIIEYDWQNSDFSLMLEPFKTSSSKVMRALKSGAERKITSDDLEFTRLFPQYCDE
ncbi:hypothetical protein GPK34_00465 [Secundilactobacillus kimchicus]|uniref:hypothetical protein n=1 Tax=Secundilactobacillus kimchicus TaxID=528209 RepID=UPI001C0170A8|nr:hypothetical protein [Secundilactobacillus kimchicus]MBT9670510.1 hypothetical protein [Secundilactobacillus kimchicus]